MIKTVNILPPVLLFGMVCAFVEPVRTTLAQLFFLFSLYDVATIKVYILSFGIWDPIISFALMLFQSVIAPLPAFLITFANAAN